MTNTRVARRDFLRLSGLVGGAAGLEMLGLRPAGPAELQAAASADEWIPTTCMMCGGTTGVLAHVVNGRVIKIEPNKFNPAGVANMYVDFVNIRDRTDVGSGARMCPKGNAAMMSLYDPDRLKKPLKRRPGSDRGSGQFVDITYEDALLEIAQKLGEIRASGPEKLLWFTEDNNFSAIQQSFCNAFDTPNFLQHSNICDVARKVGFETTLGFQRPLPDLKNTKYMLIFGWNPLGAMKWAHLPRILLDGLANGAKLVIVDPRCSETAEKALSFGGRWLPIKPGTDGALALAMANVIIGEKLYDAAFVADWTVGFTDFSKFVATKTPNWAAPITGISADTIRTVARELARTKPAVVDAWSGVSHHTNGSQGQRAVAMLAGLIGQVDAPGTLILPERAGPKFATGTPSGRARVDGKGTTYPLGHGSGVYVGARDAMIGGLPYQSRAAFFVFQNFVHSVPNVQKNLDALNMMELVVSVDTHLSETAMMADYVIPGTNFLERWDLYPQWVTFPAISLRQPVVPPVFGQKTEYEFVQDLANKLGLTIGGGGYPFTAPYTQYLSDALLAGVGISLTELQNLPGATWVAPNYSQSYRKYTVAGFNTPSKKFEFYSQQMRDKGLDPLPEYVTAQDGPTSAYPFHLINWKEALHTHSRTMNNRWLMELHGENELWINTRKAAALGIADGQMVWVENQYAKAQAKARVTNRIRPDVVGMTHGFGHTASGPEALGKGTNDTQFIPGRADPISGMAAHKDGAVKVYRA
jgi:thiosulfate reductase/polysulfide reductase chain A